MGCCCKKRVYPPTAILVVVYDNFGSLLHNINVVGWNDSTAKKCNKGCTSERLVFWQFSVNGVIMWEEDSGGVDDPFPLGASTFLQLLGDKEAIENYLTSKGVLFNENDTIGVKTIVQNCNGLTGHSNLFTFTAGVEECVGWITLDHGGAHSLDYGCWVTLDQF